MKKNSAYDFYKKHYNLENINIKLTDKKMLFLIYDDKYYYYLDKDKFLDSNFDINLLNVIKKINDYYKIDVINYYPVCFCNKTLVIALRIVNNNHICLKSVKEEEISNVYKPLVEYHRKYFKMLYVSSNVNKEIKMSQRYINRYHFHNNVIKKYILTDKRRKKEEFKERLRNLISERKSIIDVSCGDNYDVFEIASEKKYDVIVGNDICINYLETQNNNVTFYTNDDVELNRIKSGAYEVAYCKNTLHHMNNLTNIRNMLSFLNAISTKEIIIVEIINPLECGGLPKFLNKYLYTSFLKDAGNCYLNESQFKQVINNEFNVYKIEYSFFRNILGKYIIAKITKGG